MKLIQRFARQIEREPLVQQYGNTVSGPEESAEQLKQSLLRDLTRIVADNSDQKLIRRLMQQLPSNTLVQQSGSEENPERQNHFSSQRSSLRDANLVLENRKTAVAEILGQREALIPQIQEKLLSITTENNQSLFPALRFSVPHRIPSVPLQNVSDSRLQLRPGRLPMLKLSGLPEGEMRITAIRPFSSQGKYDLLAYHNQYQRQEDVPVPAQVVSQQENLSALSLQYTASPSGEMQNASNGEQMAKIQQRLAASERSLMQLRKEQENLAREFFRKADESLLEQRFYRRIQEDIHLAAKRHGRE